MQIHKLYLELLGLIQELNNTCHDINPDSSSYVYHRRLCYGVSCYYASLIHLSISCMGLRLNAAGKMDDSGWWCILSVQTCMLINMTARFLKAKTQAHRHFQAQC